MQPILKIDLSSGETEQLVVPPAWEQDFLGGASLAARLLYPRLTPELEPLSPQAPLLFLNGPLSGTSGPAVGRFVVCGRSPATRLWAESNCGGFWGPELKMAGFEGVVVKGCAAEPVCLWIQDGQAQLRPAGHLWGKTPLDVQTAIRAELGDDKIRVLQTGQAGENLVRMACITNDLRHFNGRNGIGAVMGSKKLRAIAVRGHQRYLSLAKDAAALGELGRKLAKEVQAHPASVDLQRRGTPGLVEGLNAGGILPTLNFRLGAFENVDEIKWEAYEREILTARRSCYACAVRCKREVAVDGRTSEYGGPEYETVAAFGSNIGVDDIHFIAKAGEMCNIYTLDTISTGGTIAFAMECFEHGLLTLEDTGGIELRFGNKDAALKMIELIATRQGIGNLLAEGSKRAAEVIGGDAHFFAMQVKGQEFAMHEARGKWNVGMGYAVSETGADHLVVAHDTTLANPESLSFKSARAIGLVNAHPPRLYNEEKMDQFFRLESWNSLEKTIGLCFFGPAPRSFIQPEDVLKAIEYATGWELTMAEALQIGERGINIARAFNVREGFSRADDQLPERMFQPLEGGALSGQSISRADFEQALTWLYRIKGWDVETACPTRARLEALSLGWAADLLEES